MPQSLFTTVLSVFSLKLLILTNFHSAVIISDFKQSYFIFQFSTISELSMREKLLQTEVDENVKLMTTHDH